MKHIKVKVTYVPRNHPDEQVRLVIVDQTHREHQFGPDGSSSFCHGSVKLASYSYPEIYSGWGYEDIEVCLRGSAKYEDSNVLYTSLARWKSIKAAIEAYNAEFA